MKKIFLALTIITLAFSCEVEGPDCEENNWGSLTVDSWLEDPYKVYIDGAYKGTVPAWGRVTYSNISSGTHATEYVQESGYLFTADTYTLSVNISDCETFTTTLDD